MPRTMTGLNSTRKPGDTATQTFRKALLDWYDRFARVLPWRSIPGQTPDPYHVWLSEVMLQQTTVQAVIPYFGKFVDNWPTVQDLAAARDEEVMQAWAGLGYYARARNLLKCARVIAQEHGGRFPDTVDGLKALPGIGDYTSAAIASIAFDAPATVIDGNVDRVISRWFAIETPLPDSKPEIRASAALLFQGDCLDRPGDFAQAMMDLGATICTPKSPKCMICPVSAGCAARLAGLADILPRRKDKAARPQRAGFIYWITNSNGEVLFETRPAKGLLGGMVALPTSDWVARETAKAWPAISHISAIKTEDTVAMAKDKRILHTFTHFDLELRGVLVKASRDFIPSAHQFWVAADQIAALGLPTVFRKFVRLMVV